jgi:hypothetical protein
MDIDRIDELCRKLSNKRLEIRSRAIENILFKLEKGLITVSGIRILFLQLLLFLIINIIIILGISCCQNVLVDGIYDSLSNIIDNDNDNDNDENNNNDSWRNTFPPSMKHKHFISILNVIQYIGKMRYIYHCIFSYYYYTDTNYYYHY